MASTIAFYTGDGNTTDFTVPFDYLAKKFVRVSLGVTILKGGDYGDTSKDYYFLDKTKVRLKVPPQEGEVLTIRRYTSATDRVVSFKDASVLKATDLDVSAVQTIHIAEEARDIINDALIKDKKGNWDAKGNRIVNVGDAVSDGDAVNLKLYKEDAKGAYQSKLKAEAARDAAKVSETNAKASEVNAKESEVTAKTSAGTAVSAAKHADASAKNASASASTATTQATNASNSAKAAKLSEDNAALSKTAASTSATNAKAYEVEAKRQADLAKGYANQASSGQVNADWNETVSTSKAFILNKPTLGALASKDSIAYSEITGTPPEQDLSGLATKNELQTGLAGKANSSHTHTKSQITDFPAIPDTSTLIPKSGNRGALAGYSTSATGTTVNATSGDSLYASTNVTVANGATGQTWTKVVKLSAGTVTLGTNWSWVGGEAPELKYPCLLVCHWNQDKGIAGIVTGVA